MNVYLDSITVMGTPLVLTAMMDLNVHAKKTTLGMGHHVSVRYNMVIKNLILRSKYYYYIDKMECKDKCSQRCIESTKSSFCGCENGYRLLSDLTSCEGILNHSYAH